MSDDADRRIEEAAAQAQREADASEFLKSLTKNDEVVKPIHNPEAYILRSKAKAAASRGELPTTLCRHTANLDYLGQYVDDDATVKRKGTPLNLFECSICGMLLWLVDPWGNEVSDR